MLLFHRSAYHKVHTILKIDFFRCVIYLDSVRDRTFGSIWDYLRSRDNLRVFSTALKSENQP